VYPRIVPLLQEGLGEVIIVEVTAISLSRIFLSKHLEVPNILRIFAA
jgi:hypothetical protein